VTTPFEFEALADLRDALQPTRWSLLAAAAEGVFRAEDAFDIVRDSPDFRGQERTARCHAARLKDAGLLAETELDGWLAYGLTDTGRRVYWGVLSLLQPDPDAVQPRTEPQLLAVLATLKHDEFDAFWLAGEERLDLTAVLKRRLETVIARRARIRVEPLRSDDQTGKGG
jgi:hypothetical protein